jgi:hypothetical protein
MHTDLTRIAAGKYQHTSGAIIEKRGRRSIGRNGWAAAGWAIVVDGRETLRYSTLAKAADAESARIAAA